MTVSIDFDGVSNVQSIFGLHLVGYLGLVRECANSNRKCKLNARVDAIQSTCGGEDRSCEREAIVTFQFNLVHSKDETGIQILMIPYRTRKGVTDVMTVHTKFCIVFKMKFNSNMVKLGPGRLSILLKYQSSALTSNLRIRKFFQPSLNMIHKNIANHKMHAKNHVNESFGRHLPRRDRGKLEHRERMYALR
jgi:hypothetical protein